MLVYYLSLCSCPSPCRSVPWTIAPVQFSFMGSPSVPRRLQTGGVYALLRHPQALGNMLFLIGGLGCAGLCERNRAGA